MRIHLMTAAAALLVAQAGLASPPTPPKPPAKTSQTIEIHKTVKMVNGKEVASTVANATMAHCGGYKFETSAESAVAGKKQVSRIKLCAAKGESKATWIASLEKAQARVKSESDMPAASRAKIVDAFNTEIGRLKHGG